MTKNFSLSPERIQKEFPVLRNWIYYNHAAVAPLTASTADAMKALIQNVADEGAAEYRAWNETIAEARILAARLIKSSPEEVAFTSNTSEGINIIAKGFPWKKGDNLIVPANEFPANLIPWQTIQERGVEIRKVHPKGGRILLEDIASLADERTRLLTLSFVSFETGFRIDLEAAGAFCRERNIFFFVDAIQGLGAFPVDVEKSNIHSLSADGHKWLLGPEGCALFYCRKEFLDALSPPCISWMSMENFSPTSRDTTALWPSARRFEYGTLNTPGIFGLKASLELLLSAGIETLEERILAVTDFLAAELKKRGWEILSPRGKGESSGILIASLPGKDPRETASTLHKNGVILCARGGGIRISPHFYNTIEEAGEFLKIIDRLF